MPTHKVVKHDEWLRARKRHLAKEKEFTRMREPGEARSALGCEAATFGL
jgi:predicted dithiol-disulfide oxidoreductase (DUF899 family)